MTAERGNGWAGVGSLLSYSRGLWRFGVFVFACSGDYASLAHVLLPCRGRMIL